MNDHEHDHDHDHDHDHPGGQIAIHLLRLDETCDPDGPFTSQEIDPGIIDLVHQMRAAGLPTHDSGDGVSKEPGGGVMPFRHVIAYTGLDDWMSTAVAYRDFAVAQGMTETWNVEPIWAGWGYRPAVMLFETGPT